MTVTVPRPVQPPAGATPGPARARRHPPAATLAGVMLVLAGAVYASPLVEFVHDGPVSPQDSYLSELSARSQPWSWAFRLADGLAGALLLAAAVLVTVLMVGARRRAQPRRTAASGGQARGTAGAAVRGGAASSPLGTLTAHLPVQAVAVVALAVFGVATVLDAAFPLDCPVSQEWCVALERAGEVSAAHHVHTVTSVLASTASTTLACAVAVAGVVRSPRMHATAVEAALAAGVILTTVGFGVWYLLFDGVPGDIQRLNTLCVCAVLVGAGVGLIRGRTTVPGRAG